jgi:hypothetical protein
MRRTPIITLLAAGAIAWVGVTAQAASAATAWTNTPANIESLLLRWETSDGEPLTEVSCRGVWWGPPRPDPARNGVPPIPVQRVGRRRPPFQGLRGSSTRNQLARHRAFRQRQCV